MRSISKGVFEAQELHSLSQTRAFLRSRRKPASGLFYLQANEAALSLWHHLVWSRDLLFYEKLASVWGPLRFPWPPCHMNGTVQPWIHPSLAQKRPRTDTQSSKPCPSCSLRSLAVSFHPTDLAITSTSKISFCGDVSMLTAHCEDAGGGSRCTSQGAERSTSEYWYLH